jgi:hypothetical protein
MADLVKQFKGLYPLYDNQSRYISVPEGDIIYIQWNDGTTTRFSKWSLKSNGLIWTKVASGGSSNPVYNSKYKFITLPHNQVEGGTNRRGVTIYDEKTGDLINQFFVVSSFIFAHSGSCAVDGETMTFGFNGALKVRAYIPSTNSFIDLSSGFLGNENNFRQNWIGENNDYLYYQMSTTNDLRRIDFPSATNRTSAGGNQVTRGDGKFFNSGFWKKHFFTILLNNFGITGENATKDGVTIVASNFSVGSNIYNFDVDIDGNIYFLHASQSGNFISKYNSYGIITDVNNIITNYVNKVNIISKKLNLPNTHWIISISKYCLERTS